MILFVVLTLVALAALSADLSAEGNSWKQGDWLINSDVHLVRRGIAGSALIRLADLFGASPVLMAVLLQAALLVLFAACIISPAAALCGRPEYWMLFFSPGFPLVYWAANRQAGGRKELISLAVLAVVAAAGRSRAGTGAMLVAAAALYAFGALGHEVNVLLCPAVIVAIWLVARDRGLPVQLWSAALLICVAAAGVAIAVDLTHPAVADSASVCQPLLERGVSARMCKGAIAWTSFDTARARGILVSALKAVGHGSTLRGAAVQAALSFAVLVPIVYLCLLHDRARLLLLVLAGCLLSMLPLFLIATDWGRWVDILIGVFALLLLILRQSGRVSLRSRGHPAVIGAVLVATLVWVPLVAAGGRPALLVQSVAGPLRRVLGG